MNFSDETRYKLLTLFTPGSGGRLPPYLAGRESEKQFFRLAVYTLMEKRQGNQSMIVYGPRGNGKTTMLRYLQKETLKKAGNRLEILWVTPSEFKGLGELVDLVVGNDPSLLKQARKLFSPLFDNLAASANIGVASVKTTLNRPRATLALKALLREKSKKKPFILIMDEAHTLDPDIGKVLLNASQDILGEDCPVFLVLAGTPGLIRTLSQAGVSFWERDDEFPLGRLSVEESVEALVKPLQPFGIPFARGVAGEVATKANCYPFFLQVWGKCLVDELLDSGKSSIDRSMVMDAEPRVIERRNLMYAKRFTELNDRTLLPIAGEVANTFIANDNKPISVLDIDALVGDLEKVKALERLGYIWWVLSDEGGKLSYEPGIPSMMNFVQRQTVGMVPPEKTKEVETGD